MKTSILACTIALGSIFSASATECTVGQTSNYTVIPHYYASNNSDAAFYVTNPS